jgi:hypothetical protein
MASVLHSNLLPNACFPYQEEVKWYYSEYNGEIITDLGVAPEEAHLRLTKEEATALYWRVKEWEISWGIGEKEIFTTIGDANYEFSYPKVNYSYIVSANHIPDIEFIKNEKELICRTWNGGIPRGLIHRGDTPLSISSIGTIEGQTFDTSRNTIYTDLYASGDFIIYRMPIENGILVETAWIPDALDPKKRKLYFPYSIDLDISISTSASDFTLFDEEFGGLPPIRGSLTTLPTGSVTGAIYNATPTQYTVEIHIPDNGIIEMPLFDATEPTEISNVKFNVDGFTGIKIKPHSYWPYDPEDGKGPFYDSETGVRLRQFI